MNDTRIVRLLPYLWDAELDEMRLEAARVEGWLFEELPDGRCLIDAAGSTGDFWLAPTLALAVEAICLEADDDDDD